MSKTDFTDRYTSDKDEKLLLRRLSDLLSSSERSYTTVYSAFLDPAQISLAAGVREFGGMIDFVGGYDGAERCLARLRANEYCEEVDYPACNAVSCLAEERSARLGILLSAALSYVEHKAECYGKYKVERPRNEAPVEEREHACPVLNASKLGDTVLSGVHSPLGEGVEEYIRCKSAGEHHTAPREEGVFRFLVG